MRDEIPDDLLTIGEFANLSDVPARTLRYYDEIELFQPAFVDPVTKYRYYAPSQLRRINHILALKDLGLSLEQIGQLLEEDLGLSELRGMLRLKRIEIQEILHQEKARLARVEARLRQIEEAGLRGKREGGREMRRCPHCERPVLDSESEVCPYCGKPLTPPHAALLPFDKSPSRVTVRAVAALLTSVAVIALVAGLASLLTHSGGERALLARPPSDSPPPTPQLALLSVGYERLPRPRTLVFEGEVKNISDAPVASAAAVVSLYDADPRLITASQAPIARTYLSPGETSSFTVELDASPLAHSYRVVFLSPSGSIIPTADYRAP